MTASPRDATVIALSDAPRRFGFDHSNRYVKSR